MSDGDKLNFVQRHLQRLDDGITVQTSIDQWAEGVEQELSKPGANLLGMARARLIEYRGHRTGSDLFKGYLAHRAMERERIKEYTAELDRILALADSIEPKRYVDAMIERQRFEILEALDEVIADLDRFCDNQGPPDDQLPNIRSALRIGRGHAPHDSLLRGQRDHARFLWGEAFMKMMRHGSALLLRTKIADAIAAQIGISRVTALKCLRNDGQLLSLEETVARFHNVRTKIKAPSKPRLTKARAAKRRDFTYGRSRTK